MGKLITRSSFIVTLFLAACSSKPKGKGVVDLMPGVPEYSLSKCSRCKVSWKWVHGHHTFYVEPTLQQAGRGCFPLCESCWAALTPKQRLPYYQYLFKEWDGEDPHTWTLIKNAVLEGK